MGKGTHVLLRRHPSNMPMAKIRHVSTSAPLNYPKSSAQEKRVITPTKSKHA